MGIRFNADDVFEMAIRAEQNAGAFYRKVAELSTDPENRDYLASLASMEDEHEMMFAEMRSALSDREKEPTAFDPDDESSQYLATMVDQKRLEGAPSVAETMTGEESMEDILRLAIQLEKEAILFYLGMADMVEEEQGKDKVEEIIAEEKSHVVGLAKRLGELRRA